MLDSDVVLTKIKCLRNFQERRHAPDRSGAVELLHAEAPDDAEVVFPESQLSRLYKFESEDSGVELPSGANSPSTPTGSEQSFALCESPCHGHQVTASPQEPQQVDLTEGSATPDVEQLEDSPVTLEELPDSPATLEELEDSPATLEELHSSTLTEDRGGEDDGVSGAGSTSAAGDGGECVFGEQLAGLGRDLTTMDPLRGDETSLEEYMDQCCRLSEVSRQTSPWSR